MNQLFSFKMEVIHATIFNRLILLVWLTTLFIDTQAQHPGGINGSILWLKANDGTTNTGSSLDAWADKAALPNTFTKTGNLGYTANSINFNPAISIINSPDQTVLPPNRLDGNTSITYVDGFAVFRGNSVKTCLLGGINPGNNYGVGIFLADGNPEIGVGNGTSSSWAEFDNNNYTSYGIVNLDVSLGSSPYTSGRYNGISQTLSWKGGTPYSSITFTPMIGGTNNNGNSNGWYPFDGDVTEIILFPTALDATAKQKVESYLAIKYGITLGNNTNPVSYLSSAGTTIWTADAAFQYDVFGIGLDAASGLSQASSNSYNTGSGTGAGQSGKGNIVVSGPSSFDDGDFLVIGHNNEPLTRHSVDLPAAYADRYRIKREWKAVRTGNPGNVTVSFDITGLSVNGTQATDFFLLIDNDGDGDFTNATAYSASGFASNIATFSNVTFSANSVFTFITGQQPAGPAGVTGPSLWLKANDGASASGNNLSNWIDKANLNTFTEVGSVGYTANAINYYPVVTFTNNTASGDNTVLPTNRLDGNVPVEYIDGFAVFKTNRQSSGPENGHTYGTFYTIVGSTVKGSSYGAGIFAGDDNEGRVYSGNGTHEHYQYFQYSDYNHFNIANIDVSTSSDPFATGRLNGVNQTMAYDGANDFSSIMVTPMIGGTNNDGNSNGFYALNGEVAEVVLYPKSLVNADKAKIESYLALKYGISLGSNTDAVAYVSSAGTEIWAADATFKYDIFGIGKDDNSQLNQSISNSYNTGSGNGTGQSGKGNIVVSNPSTLADGSFLVIGHNNGLLTPTTTDLPAAYAGYQRVLREWKAQKTGTVGTVSLSFDMNGIQYTSTQNNQFFLLVDANGDGDFSDATATAATSYSGGVATFTGISFTNASTLFTFVTGPELTGPGGIKGTSLWLKANDGANTSGANLTGWTDKASVNNTLNTTGTVNYTTNALNFNPAVSISNSGGLPAALPANRLDGNYSVEFIDGFAVYQSNSNLYTLVGSTVAGTSYGPGIFMGDSETNPRVYAGNGTSSTYQYFNLTNLSRYNISNLDVSLATDPFATGRLNGLSKTMYNGGGSDYSSITITPMIGGTNNKGNSSGFYPFNGSVSEIVLFPKSLTENEKIKVESYLALKYGITLDISVANYLSSSGTAIWNNTTHWNDVFGIGKDDDSGLNQTSSNSYNTGSGDGTGQSGKGNIVISNPTSLDNGDFLMIGRNNKALSHNTLDLPATYQEYQRLQREWKVQLTGTVGTVNITFDLNGISYTGTSAADFVLLLDDDGIYSNATTQVASSFSGGIATFTNVTLSNDMVFTFITGPQLTGPGSVKGPSLWLKANDGAVQTSGNLTDWTDKAGANDFATTIGTIAYTENSLNFNPAVSIDNTGGTPGTLATNRLDGNNPIEFVDGFAVYKSSTNLYTLVGSTVVGTSYGPGIFMGDSETNPRVYAGNGTGSTYQYFNLTNLSSFNISNLDVSLATDPFATGRLNGLSKTMHNGGGSDFSSITITPMIGGTNNNGVTYGFYPFTGSVSEVVLYPKGLTGDEKLKIESYLAVKYGITLDVSVTNYLSSAGTVIWNNATYWNDVFGIGKDDGSQLNQTTSNSYNTGSGDGTGQSGKGNIVVSNAANLDDGDFVLIGHNNGALTEQTTGLPAGYTTTLKRLTRQWIAEQTGSAGTVTLSFSTLGLPVSGATADMLFIIIDSDTDGDLSTGTPVVKKADAFLSGTATFSSIMIPDGAAFTFASLIVNTWTGTASTDWANTGNWSEGVVPTASDKVVIPGGLSNYPLVGSGTANAKKITMAAGAKLDVATGATLAVTDTLLLVSDDTNSASFINNGTFTGTVSYQRYLTGVNKWHLVAAPVTGQDLWNFATAAGNNVAASSGKRAITTYNEGTDDWNAYPTTDPSVNFAPGTGYSMLRTADGTVTFTGSLNNSDVTGLSLTRTAGTGFGWNLLGNPYPSAINAKTNVTADKLLNTTNVNNLDPNYGALYLWDAASGAYVTVSNTGATFPSTSNLPNHDYIQAGQGFFVKSKTGGGLFDITKAMRSHQTDVALKSGETGWPAIRLQAENGNKTSSTVIAFNNQMTTGLDVSYDAGMFKADKNFALYSRLVTDNGVDFAIQALPENYDKLLIPIGIDVPAGTEITFSALTVNLPGDAAVYLEDRAAKTITQLDVTGAKYAVTITDKIKGTGNFFLHTSSATTVVNQLENNIQVYTRDNDICISGSIETNDVVSVVGIDGKLHYKNTAARSGLLRIDASRMPAGVYLVNISGKTKGVTKKVVITE